MLVLTRKLMEKVFIGDDICVTVVRLEGGQVRLGIEAPREIAVVRAELLSERPCAMPVGSVYPAMGLPSEVTSRSVVAHEIGNRRPGPSR